MNSIKYKFFLNLLVFILIISIRSYCNDGAMYYWGPERIHTVEEKTVNTVEKSIKVYKGAGENFEIDERAVVPNGIKVDVYATITNGNTKWSLIKYYYCTEGILTFIRDEEGNEFDNDYLALEYYNKLSLIKQYEEIAGDPLAGKDFGWVKDQYLLSEKELQEKYKKIFESEMREIESRNESIEKIRETEETTKENITNDEKNNNKKDNIFDIIKKFFGLKK